MNLMLAFKAEIILALQLVARHRTPRLAVFIAAAIAVVMRATASPAHAGSVLPGLGLCTGCIAATSASRLCSRGAPLASLRLTASPAWLAPCGRLAGLLLFVAVAVGFIGVALVYPGGAHQVFRPAFVLLLYAAAIASPLMALTPITGASVAAGSGIATAILGSVPPGELPAASLAYPGTDLLEVVWHSLPLPWRAAHWVGTGGAGDLLVLAAWVLLGTGVAASHTPVVAGRWIRSRL